MPLRTKLIETALKKKGFTENISGKHKTYILYMNGKKTPINTRTSHSHKEIDNSMLNKMAMQMKISRKDFEYFVECTLSEKEYKNKLLTKKEITIETQKV